MSGPVYPAGVTTLYGETLSLSSSLASLGMPGEQTKQAILYCPVDFRLHVNPKVLDVVFYDASNSAGARYEKAGATSSLKEDLTDRSATGTGTALDSAAAGDRLYICFSDKVGGFYVDMTASVNGTANTMTVNYWNGSAWATTSATDNTDTGASLAQDGAVTFTSPSAWQASQLGGPPYDGATQRTSISDTDAPGTYGYWLQVLWDNGLDADTEIANIWALNKNTNRGYFRGGVEYSLSFNRQQTGAIEAILGAGTELLQVTWIRNIQ